jgi:cytochrome b involved in lipid metabolism
MTTYTLEQVSKHTKSGDIWLAIRGKVYDVSSFVAEHPGGEEVIRDVAG